MTFEFSNADIMPDIPVLDDISGLTTIEMTLDGSGGAGGDGGEVTLNSNGNIWTEGDFAMGVVAQSVAGGGGLAGFYNPHGITDNQIVNAVFNTLVDTDAGLSFAGSVGGAGTAGNVIANHTGNIQTLGDGAHGLFAQSAAGGGPAGNVDITLNGDIYTFGDYAFGIYAQSGGLGGNGDILVMIHDGTVMGGSGMGSGLFIAAGDNNSVWNSGLVTSVTGIYGNAIRATGGDEFIENYGTVTGNVSLGAGANAFNNRQGATFNTGATVALGAGNLLNNNGMLLPGGSGNVLTTTLTGNLAQSDTGTFEVDVFRDGNHDKLLVSGTIDVLLDGTLSVKKEIKPYEDGTTYDIIEATGAPGLTGSFSQYDMHSSPLLQFNYRQLSDIGFVDVTAPSFTTVATNRVERAIAGYLDRIMPTSTGDLEYVIGAFQSLSLSEFSNAFASLSPGQYDNSTRTTYDVIRQHTQTLLKRIHSVRLTGSTASTLPQIKVMSGAVTNFLAYSGSDASLGQLYSSGQKDHANYGLWLDAFGSWGDQDESDGFTGYDYDLYGATIGFDRIFRNRYILGISIGYSETDIGLDGNQGDGEIESLYGSVYGSYYTERGYIDAALSYGDQDYRNSRRIVIGPIERTARSDHNGEAYSAFAEGGYNFELNSLILQPFASLQYISLDEEGFTEKGAGSINQIIGDRDTESLVSELGLRMASVFKRDTMSVIPEVSAAWNYDFDIDDRVITTAFAGSPNDSFSIRGQDVEKHGLTVGAGLTLVGNGGFSASLMYDGEFREKYQSHGVIGDIRFEF
jgi:outer membrane autotransporter protein